MIIEFDLNREYVESNHYLVIANTSSYRPGDNIHRKQTGTLTILMGMYDFYFNDEEDGDWEMIYSVDDDGEDIHYMGMWHIKIEYVHAGFKVTADHEEYSIDIYRQETAFWPKVWIWLGADDDRNKGSDFHNLTIPRRKHWCWFGIT